MKSMKTTLLRLLPLAFGCGSLHAQTIEWGSVFGNTFETSAGAPLDNTFVFELGAFDMFTPTPSNPEDWFANWRVFDTGAFNPALGYVTGVAQMNATGGSSSPSGDSSFDFQGLQAYVWIRNEDTPSPTSEWFLAVDPTWIYPNVVDDCCGNDFPLQWVIDGPVLTIPEPSGAMLLALTAVAGLLRRRR